MPCQGASARQSGEGEGHKGASVQGTRHMPMASPSWYVRRESRERAVPAGVVRATAPPPHPAGRHGREMVSARRECFSMALPRLSCPPS
jgi:hypothetical protein